MESFALGAATLRLPQRLALSRIVSSQRNMTTVQLNTGILNPPVYQDALVTARVIRADKNLLFGVIHIVAVHDSKSVCRVSTTDRLL